MRAEESGHITCILCPKGCRISFHRQAGDIEFSGYGCPRGEEYARKEIVNPERILTSTVRTVFTDFPRLPVKTNREIPLGEVREYMKAINSVLVRKRCIPGDVVVRNLMNRGVDLLATAAMDACGLGREEE